MSRLIVKNLPNQVTVDKLKNVFSQKGEITDVQLKYTKEGKFRNFGFVGFKTEEQAKAAQEHFNGTCIQTKRIVVEPCASLGSTTKPQAWSKYAPDSSAFRKANGIVEETEFKSLKLDDSKLSKEERKKLKQQKRDEKIKQILERHKDDPLFTEFMEVHASTANKAIWSNDNVSKQKKKNKDNASDQENDETENNSNQVDEISNEPQEVAVEENKLANQKISDLEYMNKLMNKSKLKKKTEAKNNEDVDNVEVVEIDKPMKKKKTPQNRVLFMVKIRGLPFSCKKKDIKDFFRPLVPFTIRIPRAQNKAMRGFCYVGFRTEDERIKALLKNRSFLGGNHVNVDRYDNQRKIDSAGDEQEENPKHKTQEEALKHEESIAESGRIYVRNLPYIVTEDEVQALFEKYGPVAEITLPVDKITHQAKGFGIITFMMPEHAVKAYTDLDGSVFCGRMLHLLPGKQKESEADDDDGNLTYKQKKDKKQKAQSGSSHNWNTLFLGANAVADAVAKTYDTTKEKLLDSNSKTSAAVKLALGETQLVMNTRKFMEENGICLDVFNQAPKKRSKTIILVKNLPAQTARDELWKVFEPFGTIARLILPPYGITALVEFVEPSEAKKAFSKLAYSKFKHLPLYLEWSPDNVFSKPAETKSEKLPDNKETRDAMDVEIGDKNQIEVTKNEDEDEEEVPEPETTLFVKGLNFETGDETLRKHFESCGRVHSVTVAMKKDPHNPGKKLSMGYGFVQFYMKSTTDKALKNLQMSNLDGKQIELKRSERAGQANVKTSRKEAQLGKQTGTKILVRNVPFQANRQEIQDIFVAFGEIKALRMPRKMMPGENRHRGFCFVEYFSKSDAKKSFETLCQSTHLYGRRLVLEWAKLEDSDDMVNDLRKRTAESFNQSMPGGKKSKKAVVELEDMDAEEE
ncbi:putative RNA-binding protein 19 [Arctopsyche grandis]|uniref:putative RNA-binding protein 19 n=1 Tax=Arctopsyche grandis TaxID=121162 RepID=UPI00406D73CA